MANSKTMLTRIAHRTDTTQNWTTNDPVLLKGELAITMDQGQAPKLKIGVGGTTKWSEIDYTYDLTSLLAEVADIAEEKAADAVATIGSSVFTDTDLANISGMKKGDIAIITSTIAGDAVQHTAYVYDGSKNTWVAMDGNYDATNVYFKNDLVFTTPVGTVTIPSTGSATVEAAGKNLQEVFAGIFAAEDSSNLQETAPALSISTSLSYVEVGKTVSPAFTAVFSDGKYRFGPEPTGVTAIAGSYVSSNNKTAETIESNTGTFASYTFGATHGDKYTVTVKCNHTAGANPTSNIGKEYSAQAFAAVEGCTVSKDIYQTYIPNFYGYKKATNKLSAINNTTITSDVVRNLGNNQKQTTAPVTSFKINEKWMQFFYAVPTGRKTTLTAKDSNNVTLGVTKVADVTVNHEGSVSTSYTVFVIDNAAEYDPTTIQMTWA